MVEFLASRSMHFTVGQPAAAVYYFGFAAALLSILGVLWVSAPTVPVSGLGVVSQEQCKVSWGNSLCRSA